MCECAVCDVCVCTCVDGMWVVGEVQDLEANEQIRQCMGRERNRTKINRRRKKQTRLKNLKNIDWARNEWEVSLSGMMSASHRWIFGNCRDRVGGGCPANVDLG